MLVFKLGISSRAYQMETMDMNKFLAPGFSLPGTGEGTISIVSSRKSVANIFFVRQTKFDAFLRRIGTQISFTFQLYDTPLTSQVLHHFWRQSLL